MARKKPFAPLDNLFTLYQTMSVRAIARELGVDRRTVQRWKNEGQKPLPKNAEILADYAKDARKVIRSEGRKAREHWAEPDVAVPLVGKRQYVRAEVPAAEYKRLRERAKTDPRFRTDQFKTKKDQRGRRHYYHLYDGGAVVFKVGRARDQDVLNFLNAARGQGRSIVLLHELTKEYKMKDGTILPKGRRLGSRPEYLDSGKYGSAEAILDLIQESKRKGRLVYIRVSDPAK